ncbi:MAG: chromate efflux transporter [Rubrivivax sp.]|nr:chromate efflux transporter [Rubrivivax sp.]
MAEAPRLPPLPGTPHSGALPPHERGTAREVLRAFLKLGLSSFGGPVAHLGYFRAEFVERRRWLGDRDYAELVALCQFLPGPASSQVGFAIGLRRAGWRGALAAWAGFTLPSAIALVLFALGVARWTQAARSGAVHGLELAAAAVVAQALWGMARALCPDRLRAALAVACALLALALPGAPGQLGAMALGALVGWRALRLPAPSAAPPSGDGMGKATGALLLALFALLLVALPAWAAASGSLMAQALAVFYRAGSLVFGGGHVVLPLLQSGVVPAGWVSNELFLAGYGAAQAVPGPLFSFAAFLGAVMPAPLGGWTGACVMLVAIYVPALLLVAGALPLWASLRGRAAVQRAMGGVQAAVVGVLACALYDPVWRGAVHTRADFGLVLACFGLLMYGRAAPVLVVLGAAAAGWAMAA